MPQCESISNKTSTTRCTSNAMKGHSFCGRHARAKKPRLWSEVHQTKLKGLVHFQAVYRGWKVRRVLQWAGPGVLSRSHCVNDEDLCTFESKDRQFPFDYFGIEEAGKIWWFDFATVWEWTIRSVAPTNPYTKVPFEYKDLARLRKLHLYRRRNHLNVPASSKDLTENIVHRWTLVAHTFRTFGFDDVHPSQFANLTDANVRSMFRMFIRDLEAMKPVNHRLIMICAKALVGQTTSRTGYIINSLNLLMIGLTDTQSYDVIFLLLSALYRC